MYKQLQDILNKCIEKGWKPFGIVKEYKFSFKYNGNNDYVLMKERIGKDNFFCRECEFSTHDLFSKDSGLMEFVEWEKKQLRTKYRPFLSGHVFGILGTPFEFWAMAKYGGVDCDSNFNGTIIEYHFMIMGPKTAEEKIEYFISNVIV